MILAIDPGNTHSAFVFVDSKDYRPGVRGKVPNEELMAIIAGNSVDAVAVEMIASYGMAVGKEIFETCLWIGRFIERLITHNGVTPNLVYRRDVKLNLCGNPRAKDGNVIQALKDRFGDKGTKKNPGWFYGFKADCWQAYAVGITYLDNLKSEERKAA